MDYIEFERRLRHEVCIFLALETLAICCLMGVDALNDWKLFLHERIPISLIMPAAVIIGLTIAAMYSRKVYVQYEIIHGIVILFSWWDDSPLRVLIILLILTIRFVIYKNKLKEFRKEQQ